MRDFFLDILAVFAIFDWISPTLALFQDIANGPSHTFLVPVYCGKTGHELSSQLRAQGIKTWGHMIVHGHFMITVKKADQPFAEQILGAYIPEVFTDAPPWGTGTFQQPAPMQSLDSEVVSLPDSLAQLYGRPERDEWGGIDDISV